MEEFHYNSDGKLIPAKENLNADNLSLYITIE